MGSQPKQDLYLVRHCHRDTADRARNNGLSARGREQRDRLREYFKESLRNDREAHVLSSPKKRCLETVERILGRDTPRIEVIPALDERGTRESLALVQKRVRIFCRWWMKEDVGTILVCSHGDWIPMVTQELLGATIPLKKGALAWLRREGRGVRIMEVRQWL